MNKEWLRCPKKLQPTYPEGTCEFKSLGAVFCSNYVVLPQKIPS